MLNPFHYLKILMVLRPTQGGMREHIRLLLRGLKHRAILVVAGPPDPEMQDEVEELDGEYHEIDISPGFSPLSDWQISNDLASLILNFRFDIVHAHGFKASIPARLAAWRTSVPGVIYTCHNMVAENWPTWQKEAYWKTERTLARLTDKIIVVSSLLQRQFLRQGIPPARVALVPNGIPLKPFDQPVDRNQKRSELGVAPNQFLMVCTARLIPSKGVGILLQAMHYLMKSAPGLNLRLLVLGDGPLRQELEQMTTNLGLRQVVTFLGHRKDVREILQSADLFVLPSLSEGLPLSVLEAMAAKCPVVATAVGGIPDVIKHGTSGFLVTPGDAEAMARGLLYVISRPERRKTYVENAHQEVWLRHSSERMVEEIYRIYEEVLFPFTERRPLRFQFYGEVEAKEPKGKN